jgi:hypothetical protein
LIVSDTIEYNIVEDMKKVKANISLYEVSKLKQQQKFLLKELNAVPASPLPTVVTAKASKGKGKPPNVSSDKIDPSDAILIGDRSNSHTPPFLLTFEIFNKNVHNCLVDSGASSNIMPYSVCLKLNISPQKSVVQIVQLDHTKVKVLGEMNSVLIRLSSNSKVCQIIDILVVDIPEFYSYFK